MLEMILHKEVIASRTACRIFSVTVFILLISLGAFVRIPLPFTPVPLTLQTFFVLLSGAFLGGYTASLAPLGYLLLGIFGLPVFAGAGSGLLYLAGPTAGYLFGFVFATLFVGRYIHRVRANLVSTFCILFIADLIILGCGTFWFKLLLGQPLSKLLWLGFIPFIPGDTLKALVASWLYLKSRSRLKEVF